MLSRRWLLALLFLCAAGVSVFGYRSYMSTVLNSTARAHLDHRPRHGGTFFMSTDLVHHLEGALVPQGTFKVYMYDAYTQPLVLEDMREVSGFVEIGETVDAERVTLKLNSDGKTLDADIGKDPKFPVTLTLYLHLPGLAPDAKPELFTFHFARYSGATTGTTGMKEMKDMKDMPGMN